MDDAKNILPAVASPPKEEAGSSPRPASSPSLSVCMIVKDEEANLPRCLNSLKPLGEVQLVIVDTGSTDRTMDIAAEYGAEIYEHAWEANFAKARNQALAYAKGEWAFTIDADEVLHGGEHVQKMLKKVQEGLGGAAITMEDMQGDEVALTWTSVRFYRMSARPTWKGAYHNMITHKGGLALFEGVKIQHFGYDLTPEEMEAKLTRTEEIILRDTQKTGPGEAHRAYFYLAHIASKRSAFEAALIHGRKYVENGRGHKQFNPSIYNILFYCAMNLGEKEEADKWLSMALADIPNDLDIAYDVVLYGEWVDRQDLVIEGGRKFLSLYDAFGAGMAELANRFVYHHCPASLAYVLRKMSAALASEASGALDRYRDALNLLPEDKRAAEMNQAKAELEAAGTTWTNP